MAEEDLRSKIVAKEYEITRAKEEGTRKEALAKKEVELYEGSIEYTILKRDLKGNLELIKAEMKLQIYRLNADKKALQKELKALIRAKRRGKATKEI